MARCCEPLAASGITSTVEDGPIDSGGSRDFDVGARVRVRWASWEPWQLVYITGRRTLDDVGIVQHEVDVNGIDEWVDFQAAFACEPLQ